MMNVPLTCNSSAGRVGRKLVLRKGAPTAGRGVAASSDSDPLPGWLMDRGSGLGCREGSCVGGPGAR